jgi:phage tail-like protein
VLERLRIATGLGAWLERLPAVYARDEASAGFLARMLAALAAALEEQQRRIDDLGLLFDAGAAPDTPAAPWLDWLAGWLAFPLGDVADGARRRDAVAAAFALAARRGTSEGLRETIRLALGVPTWVSEPAECTGVWLLDGSDRLGFDTALTAAEAQGAVLGTTATIDGSHLIPEADYGAPLFDDLAHHFCVGVYARDVAAPGTRAALERLVERERPAHLRAHVCVVEPRARVGFQARVGVDAVVAGDPAAFVLGSAVLGEAATAAGAVRGNVVGATRVARRGG